MEKNGPEKPEGAGRKGGRNNRDRRNRNKRGNNKPATDANHDDAENVQAPTTATEEEIPPEPDSPMVLGGKRNWADYSFDEDLPVDPVEPPGHTEPRKEGGSIRSPRAAAGQHEDLRNKLNRNKKQQQQNGHHNSHSGGGGRGGGTSNSSGRKLLPRPKKNTENFNPCHDPPDMRILCAPPGNLPIHINETNLYYGSGYRSG